MQFSLLCCCSFFHYLSKIYVSISPVVGRRRRRQRQDGFWELFARYQGTHTHHISHIIAPTSTHTPYQPYNTVAPTSTHTPYQPCNSTHQHTHTILAIQQHPPPHNILAIQKKLIFILFFRHKIEKSNTKIVFLSLKN